MRELTPFVNNNSNSYKTEYYKTKIEKQQILTCYNQFIRKINVMTALAGIFHCKV
jgi:hypothetical protein